MDVRLGTAYAISSRIWFTLLKGVLTEIYSPTVDRPQVRDLQYLAASQRDDGGFAQNFWIHGDPYWIGIQLDEVAFPILLACRLAREHA